MSLTAGNFHKVFNREGWEYHDMLLKKFGSIARLSMVFGVR